ncbi:MAG: V-type ATP synthase subunit I [Methanoculleaceae archaeon]
MLQRMRKVLIVGPRKDFQSVIDVLYTTGTLHLENVTEKIPPEELPVTQWENEAEKEVLSLLVRIGGIIQALPAVTPDPVRKQEIYEELYWKSHEEVMERAYQVIEGLGEKTRHLSSRKSDIEYRLTTLQRYERIIEKIQPLEEQLPILEGFEVTVVLIQKEFEEVLSLIRKELGEITHNKFELISAEIDEDTVAAITVFNKRYSEQVHSFIYSKNINEVRLPAEFRGKPFYEVLDLIRNQREELQRELSAIKDEITGLSEEWYLELTVIEEVLEDKYGEICVFNQFGRTAYTFVILGWVPEPAMEQTARALREHFGDRVVMHELSFRPEEAPTLYDNPRIVRPFEFLMQLAGTPRYSEIDPTPLLAFFFPLFFGLMVGDIGYGIVILIFALAMMRRFPKYGWVQSLMSIMVISSIPTIFFGFLYGEFFGDFGEIMGWIHPMHIFGITWNRIDAIIPMTIVAVVIGVIHIICGLILGIINEFAKNKKRHMIEKSGMLLAVLGIIMVIPSCTGFVPAFLFLPGAALVVISLPMIIYGGGAMGPMEIMGTIGNILSYARLMAIGMASVILAVVANTLGGTFEVVGVGVIVAALLHTLNIVLAMFSPSIHAVRLHIVECYSKFFEGGGHFYRPFRKGKPW